MPYPFITVILTDTIPITCIIGKKDVQFQQTDIEDEYYCEDGKWGVFYYTDGRPVWVQELKTYDSYHPTHKTLTIVRQQTT